MAKGARVTVVGGGVIGLTSAIRLLQAGHVVTVRAREWSPHTTSDVAAAFWYPDGPGPAARVLEWARESLAVFRRLAARPESGVGFRPLVDLFQREVDAPPWGALVQGVTPLDRGAYPAPWRYGYRTLVPAIETPRYMTYLGRRLESLGGRMLPGEVSDLAGIGGGALVVNCTGVWAGGLAADPQVLPVRGQVVRIRRPAGLGETILHAQHEGVITYVVPRRTDVILGGSKESGEWSRDPSAAMTADILARCAALEPAVRDPEIIETRVGLRPGRPDVRLEAARLPGGEQVIHNYGHGPIGHTLAWGCAAEVAALAREIL